MRIERKYGCIGLIIPLWSCRQIELWCCPPTTNIPLHIHPGIDSMIIHVWGRVEVTKEKKTLRLPLFTLFRSFSIPSLIAHGFRNFNGWFVFINIEKWHKNVTKTSAADNLIELKSYGISKT